MTSPDMIPAPRVRVTAADPHAVVTRVFEAITAEPRLVEAALVLLGYGVLGRPDAEARLVAGQVLAADAGVRDALAFTVREARR